MAPVLLWLLVQLAALVLAALRIPLGAGYPQPAEFQAVRVLLVFQFAWVTMLFPSLLRTWGMTLVTIASAWIMLLFAAALATWAIPEVLSVAGYVSLWILILSTLRAALTWKVQLLCSAVASTYVIGGPLLAYLRTDFGTASLETGSGLAFGPLWHAVSTPRSVALRTWSAEVGIGIAVGTLVAASHFLKLYLSSNSRPTTPD